MCIYDGLHHLYTETGLELQEALFLRPPRTGVSAVALAGGPPVTDGGEAAPAARDRGRATLFGEGAADQERSLHGRLSQGRWTVGGQAGAEPGGTGGDGGGAFGARAARQA
jgi:hypothetical protein